MKVLSLAVSVLVLAAGAGAFGQSLYEQPVAAPPARTGEGAASGGAEAAGATGVTTAAGGAGSGGAQVMMAQDGPMPLASVSLFAIEPPVPREFKENDLVTIIISERSKQDRNQKQDDKKDYDLDFAVSQFADLPSMIEGVWNPTDSDSLPQVAVGSSTDFKGEGKYKREDTITDRITAKVLEVKPNGTLVLEARRSFTSDEEISVATLSGVCRSEDVTVTNTVQSNQMFDLVFNVQNSGESKRAATKGLIPRVLETLLNF